MKKLYLQQLETRDLLAVLRLAAWNTLNNPNDAVEDADYSVVLEAIGNETVVGNTKRVDILALQETDLPGSGGDSAGRIENVLDLLYPSTDYASIVSSVDSGGDATGFVYDTSTVSLLSSEEIAPASLTHTILRGEFRPADTSGESDFFVYSVHLKSGTGGADATTRGAEAAILRNDADSLGEGAAILMVGDFNMQDSFEAAHTNLTASGAGQLRDVADAPGDWSQNIAFKSLHTQNPRNAMDDRFDLQFATGEFYDDVGIEYVAGSYRVFGNDGSHTFDDSIRTGSGASALVLDSLANASDHLPVIADYETIPSVPLVRIRDTGDSTKVVEGGDYDTYQVVLDTVPTQNVTVTVSPDSELTTNVNQLVFTPGNALTPQTIVIDAFDDLDGEGDHSGLISHAVASMDADYHGILTESVAVDIVDDDAPVIVINELDADTLGNDQLEFVELYDGGVGNVSLSGKTLVFFNGSSDTAYATFDLTGQSTDANGFLLLGNAAVPDVDVVFNDALLQNGADAVALYEGSFPVGASVTTANLLDAIVYDTNDGDDAGLLVLLEPGQPQINEDENGNKDFDSLSRVPDGGPTRRTDGYALQLPTPGALNAPPEAGVLILQSGTRVDISEAGTTDSYQLALDTIPTESVFITVDPDDQSDLGSGPGVAIVLTFTPADALIPQIVSVTAIDDDDLEGDHASVITHTATSLDTTYDGLLIGTVVASVLDDEVAIPPSIVISEIMYNPDSEETEPGIAEWIEIVNTGSSQVDIGGWRFDDEDAATWGAIPQGTLLDPNQVAVFFDEEFVDATTFRDAWLIPASVVVAGLPWGGLANSPDNTNEVLELLNEFGIQMDLVNYDDANPWPTDSPDGPSIYLTDLLADNNEGSNWARSSVNVGGGSQPIGGNFSSSDVGSPGTVPASADFDGDQDIDGMDFLLWQRGFGEVTAVKIDGDANNDQLVDDADLAVWSASYPTVAALEVAGLAELAAAYLAEMESQSKEEERARVFDDLVPSIV
ncbi:MAG: lamin tail domain-containing protein [Planctomycetota bacterium]